MTDHIRTEKIGGDSILFCGHPSRAENRYDSLATPLGTERVIPMFRHMLSSFVIDMLSSLFVSICVIIMHIFLCDLFTTFSYYVLTSVVFIYGLGYEWVRSRFVYSFAHTHMHFHVINSMPEFHPFRRKCWLHSREIIIFAMASQTFLEFMVLIHLWDNNLRTIIRKCSHSNRTLSVACNGSGSGCLTSPLGTTVRSDSRIF